MNKKTNSKSILSDLVFGLMLAFVHVKDFAEAGRVVNDHEFGHGVARFTRDGNMAHESPGASRLAWSVTGSGYHRVLPGRGKLKERQCQGRKWALTQQMAASMR